jgi:chorismate mutase
MPTLCLEELLEIHRDHLKLIDEEIVELLGQRMKVSAKVGVLKKLNKTEICSPQQELKVTDRAMKNAKLHDVHGGFIVKIFRLIIEESKRIQNVE